MAHESQIEAADHVGRRSDSPRLPVENDVGPLHDVTETERARAVAALHRLGAADLTAALGLEEPS